MLIEQTILQSLIEKRGKLCRQFGSCPSQRTQLLEEIQSVDVLIRLNLSQPRRCESESENSTTTSTEYPSNCASVFSLKSVVWTLPAEKSTVEDLEVKQKEKLEREVRHLDLFVEYIRTRRRQIYRTVKKGDLNKNL